MPTAIADRAAVKASGERIGLAAGTPVGAWRWYRGDLALVSLLAAAVFAVGWRVRRCYSDDALIVLRYAHNLLVGEGWVYNRGESINAATSPLHVMVTALLGALCGDLEVALPLTFAVPFAACGIMVYRLARPCGRAAAFFAGLLATFAPRLYSTMGMETPLILATALGACFAFVARRYTLAGALCGFAILARPDAALLAMLLAWHAGRFGRDAFVRFGTACVTIATPWFVYAWMTFGSPLPSTLAIKLAQRNVYGSGPIFLHGAWKEVCGFAGILGTTWLIVVIALLAIATVLTAARAARHRAIALFCVFAALQFGCYAIGNLPPYHWYYGPAFFALSLAAGVAVVEAFASRSVAAQGVAIAASTLIVAVSIPEVVRPAPAHENYHILGAWLREHTPPEASIALAEIGVAGYHAWPRPIVDMVGLVTPGGAGQIAAGDTGWWLDHHRPDYIVFHEPPWTLFEAPATTRAAFEQHYECVVRSLPGTGLSIYQRIEPPAAAPR
jgi:hypothetical protein